MGKEGGWPGRACDIIMAVALVTVVYFGISNASAQTPKDSLSGRGGSSAGQADAAALSPGDAFDPPGADCEPCGPGELRADFRVLELVHVDPVTGEEQWEEVGTAENPIEHNQFVKFDAECSCGAAMYSWRVNGSPYGSGEEFEMQLSGPADYVIRLTIYDATYDNWDSAETTVTVRRGMRFLSGQNHPGQIFIPKDETLVGTKLWSISTDGAVGYTSVSNCASLSPVQIMPSDPLSGANSIAADEERLFVSRYLVGVDVYRASTSNFQLLHRIPLSALHGAYPVAVTLCDGVLFVAAGSKVVLFDAALLNTQPVGEIGLPGNAVFMESARNRLVVRTEDLRVLLYDISDPWSPAPAGSPLDLDFTFAMSDTVSSDALGMRVSAGTAIVWFDEFDDGFLQQFSVPSSPLVIWDRWHFMFDNPDGRVRKRDITDWREEPYVVEVVPSWTNSMHGGFVFDPDGSGPQPPILMVRSQFGYFAYEL